MLARLQQVATLSALLLAAIWATYWAMAGHAWLGLVGVAVLLGGYAVILGVEFMLLGRAHGDDPTKRATPAQRCRAWWQEVRAAPLVFCWRQPFHSQRWPDLLPADGAGRQGVLLVHGFVCNRGLWNQWLGKLTATQVPVVAVNLEPVFGSIDDMIGVIDAAAQQLMRRTGRPPIVVAHSMGGLVVRRWWIDHGHASLRHVITIGTPHHGTWVARFAFSRNGRQMRQASTWLQALAAREPPGRAQCFTCFYSHCDNIVFPPSTATLPGADNRHLPGVAHVHMVDRPEPWAELQRLLLLCG